MTVSVHRWVIKKAARIAMVLGSFVTGSLVLRKLLGRGPTIRVLTYHRFGDAVRDPWCVSAAVFEEQMRWLAEQKLAVSLDDVERFVRGEAANRAHNGTSAELDLWGVRVPVRLYDQWPVR